MAKIVDFSKVSDQGLETSPVSQALAGLRANEARYFMNKYKHSFTVEEAKERPDVLEYYNQLLLKERNLSFESEPLEVSQFVVENIKFTYVFYTSGLSVNIMYHLEDPKKRAVGFKLSEGMDIPKELDQKFKFAKQKSKLAGIIRGSFFVIKNEYD